MRSQNNTNDCLMNYKLLIAIFKTSCIKIYHTVNIANTHTQHQDFQVCFAEKYATTWQNCQVCLLNIKNVLGKWIYLMYSIKTGEVSRWIIGQQTVSNICKVFKSMKIPKIDFFLFGLVDTSDLINGKSQLSQNHFLCHCFRCLVHCLCLHLWTEIDSEIS